MNDETNIKYNKSVEPVNKVRKIIKCSKSIGWPWEKYMFDHRCIIENIWGVAETEDFPLNENCIFYVNNYNYGWKWNRQNPIPSGLCGSYNCPIYPGVEIGRSAWGADINDPCTDTMPKILPKKLSDISSLILNTTFEYTTIPLKSDQYNFAYDIWVTTIPNPTGDMTGNVEIMIWINKNNQYPAGSNTGKIFIDPYTNISYNLYRDSEGHTMSFIIGDIPATSGKKNHKVNLRVLLDFLINNGYLTNDLYLCQISLGNEVYKGKGEMCIDDFKVMMNGQSI